MTLRAAGRFAGACSSGFRGCGGGGARRTRVHGLTGQPVPLPRVAAPPLAHRSAPSRPPAAASPRDCARRCRPTSLENIDRKIRRSPSGVGRRLATKTSATMGSERSRAIMARRALRMARPEVATASERVGSALPTRAWATSVSERASDHPRHPTLHPSAPASRRRRAPPSGGQSPHDPRPTLARSRRQDARRPVAVTSPPSTPRRAMRRAHTPHSSPPQASLRARRAAKEPARSAQGAAAPTARG